MNKILDHCYAQIDSLALVHNSLEKQLKVCEATNIPEGNEVYLSIKAEMETARRSMYEYGALTHFIEHGLADYTDKLEEAPVESKPKPKAKKRGAANAK